MINKLDELSELIKKGEPFEDEYDLGRGKDKTDLLLVYLEDGREVAYDRALSNPAISLHGVGDDAQINMSYNGIESENPFKESIRPQRVTYEFPENSQGQNGEGGKGELHIDWDENKRFTIAQYSRPD